MPFVDTRNLAVIERLPGWYGRYFHSPSMMFAHYEFTRSASIQEHFHPQEEVYEVIEGELEGTIDGVGQVARAGVVAIVPANARHSVKALTDGRAHHRRLSAARRLCLHEQTGAMIFGRPFDGQDSSGRSIPRLLPTLPSASRGCSCAPASAPSSFEALAGV